MEAAIYLSLMFLFTAIMYCKMSLIWRDVMLKRLGQMKSDIDKIHKMYIKKMTECNGKPLPNPTFNQMIEKLKIK